MMKWIQKLLKRAKRIGGVVCTAIGVCCIGIGIWNLCVCESLVDEGVKVQAVCQWESNGDLTLNFESQGKKWKVKSAFQSDEIQTGDKITIYHPPKQPKKARITDGWTYTPYLEQGFFWLVAGQVILNWNKLLQFLQKLCQKDGEEYKAEVSIPSSPMNNDSVPDVAEEVDAAVEGETMEEANASVDEPNEEQPQVLVE